MKFHQTPIALAAFALLASAPFAALAAPSVSFTSPQDGATLAKNAQTVCAVSTSGTSKVVFTMITPTGAVKALNTDTSSPFNCYVFSGHYVDGNYTLKAVASDSRGATATATRKVTINNNGTTSTSTTTPPPVTATTNTPPAVTFVKPANNATVSGPIACEVTATDSDGILKLEWLLDGKLIFTETSAPFNYCNMTTTGLAAGAHTITARATDKKGATTSANVTVNVGGTTTPPPPSVPGLTAQFAAPASGGVIKGDSTGAVAGAPNCHITGTGIAKAVFFMDGVQTNYDMNGSNGWGCYFNTKSYSNGTHTLKADVYNAAGQKITISQPVTIDNGTTTPPATNTPPTVSFTAPAAGATLSGTVNSTGCVASASDSNGSVAKVDFYLGTTLLNTTTAAPYQCAIDTTKFANGAHNLIAVATDNQGATATTQRTVTISNVSTTPPPSTGAVDPADIVTSASADKLFNQQPNIYTDVLGSTPWMSTIAETGRHGTLLPNGETIRFGKEVDPVDGSRKALTFQLTPSDPTTGGSKRVELGYPRNIEFDKVYWLAVSVYVHDWGTLGTGDQGLFGFQLHNGTKIDLSPTIALYSTGSDGRSMQIHTRYSTSTSPSQSNTVSQKWPAQPIPFGQWMDIVVKFRNNVSGQGFAEVYKDGVKIVDHRGNLGFHTPGYLDFVKWGYYNWTSAFGSPRKVRLRNPSVVQDPTGSKYTEADLRGLLGTNGSTTTATTSGSTSTSTSSTGSTGGTTSGGGVCSTIECAAAQ